jgi:hypothetical protein
MSRRRLNNYDCVYIFLFLKVELFETKISLRYLSLEQVD